MEAVNCSVLPTVIEVEVLFSVMPVTATDEVVTVTVQVAVLFPSSVLTVMVAVPAALADTKPDVFTVATFVLLLLHVTFLLVALAGCTVGDSCSVPPTIIEVEVLFNDTPVTAIDTVTVQEAVLLPSLVVTVIVVVPALTAVIRPLLLTVATLELLLDQITSLLEASSGSTETVSDSLSPTDKSKAVRLIVTLLLLHLLLLLLLKRMRIA